MCVFCVCCKINRVYQRWRSIVRRSHVGRPGSSIVYGSVSRASLAGAFLCRRYMRYSKRWQFRQARTKQSIYNQCQMGRCEHQVGHFRAHDKSFQSSSELTAVRLAFKVCTQQCNAHARAGNKCLAFFYVVGSRADGAFRKSPRRFLFGGPPPRDCDTLDRIRRGCTHIRGEQHEEKQNSKQ